MNKRKSLDERRAEIVEAGLKVAMREGVEAVTVRRVAQEAGIPLGTVHYCFEDKDAMLRAMGRAIALRASEPVLAALQAGPDRMAVAEATVDALLIGLKRHQHMRLLTFEFAVSGARTPVLREVARAHLRQSIAMTREYLQRLAVVLRTTYRTEIDALARMTALSIDGIELAWMVDQDDDKARTGFADLTATVFSLMEP